MFLLVAQVFTKNLENNELIKGLKISGVDILLSLFADDTDLFLEASLSCVNALMNELEIFGLYSGCKNNVQKTICIPLGASRSNQPLLTVLKHKYGQHFVDHSFTALGINFNNHSTIQELCHLVITRLR